MESPQHLIPDFVTRTAPAKTATSVISNISRANATINGTAHLHKALVTEVKSPPALGLMLATVIILIIFALMIFSKESYAKTLASPVSPLAGFRYGDKYVYEGKKLIIRRVYLRFLTFLSSIGLSFPRGYTPKEVALEALKRGMNIASKISSIYYRFIYRPEEPSDDVINELRNLEKSFEVKKDEG